MKVEIAPIEPITISISQEWLDELQDYKDQNKLYEKIIRMLLDKIQSEKVGFIPRKWISKEEALILWPNGNTDPVTKEWINEDD